MKKVQYNFSPQESKVAELISRGTPLKEVAAQMKISINTVRVYISGIRQKTGTHSLYQAGTVLSRSGW